jgi:hypothetical protein
VATQEEIGSETMTYVRLAVASVEKKLVQHRLRLFEHIQRRPTEAPIRNGVIRRTGNKKRDLKDWCITKKLALDRRVKTSNSCARTLIFGSFLLLPFVNFFPRPFFAFLT